MTEFMYLPVDRLHRECTATPATRSSMQVRIVPHLDEPGRSVVFDVFDNELSVGNVVELGRIQNTRRANEHMLFKNKVVSRSHCKIWLGTDGKLYLQDTKSSSGTFLNHARLSPPNMESEPREIRDGDLVQLGIDYQGGTEELYRAVKMKFELNQPKHTTTAFSKKVHQKLLKTGQDGIEKNEVDECCICLYAIAPAQALFLAPCSHTYHYKCIRPLLESYPGFSCPLCRNYFDLDASVETAAMDECPTNDTTTMNKRSTIINTSALADEDSSSDSASSSSSDNEYEPHAQNGPPLSTTLTDHDMVATRDRHVASSSRRRSTALADTFDKFKSITNIAFGGDKRKRRSLSADLPPRVPETDHASQQRISRQWSSQRSLAEIHE